LEFNVPFQHTYGYIRDDNSQLIQTLTNIKAYQLTWVLVNKTTADVTVIEQLHTFSYNCQELLNTLQL